MALMNLGTAAVGLFLKIGLGIIVIIGLLLLWFAGKGFQKWRNNKRTYKITANVYNPDGTFFTDKLGKFRGDDGIDKMLFMNMKESMPVIDPKHIRANQVTLWRYAPSQYAVIPTHIWAREPKDFKIEVINYQMKNFAYLEQRAAVSRWAYVKDLIQKWAPYITVLLILVLGGVAIWLITKMNNEQFTQIAAARMAECKGLLSIGGGSLTTPPA